MKKCPVCNRTFEDSLTYCLIDGSILSAPFDPQATLVLPQQHQTVPMINPAGNLNRRLWIIGAVVTLLIAATIVVIAVVNRYPHSTETDSTGTKQSEAKTDESRINKRSDNPPSISERASENKNTESAANTQPSNETSIPDLRSLQKYAGQYAGDMFKKEPGLKQRLTNLLGSNYKLFMER